MQTQSNVIPLRDGFTPARFAVAPSPYNRVNAAQRFLEAYRAQRANGATYGAAIDAARQLTRF